MAKAPLKNWVNLSRSSTRSKLSDYEKRQITERARGIVDEWKAIYIKEPPEDYEFNYIIDVYTKWHGQFFYFYAKYACPGPNRTAPTFEAGFTRIEYVGKDRFNLAYLRHTGKWLTIEFDLTLDDCLKAIREDSFYQPS